MSLEQLNSIDDVRGLLEGTQAVIFGVTATKKERYRWVQKALVKHRYMLLNKAGKGLITRYLMKVTSYSHAQTKRLIQLYLKIGKVTEIRASSLPTRALTQGYWLGWMGFTGNPVALYINYSAVSDRVSKQSKLLAMHFVLIYCFKLILNVSLNDVLIRIANRLNKIALGPKLAVPKILFPDLWV